jgi:septal ring factor EnvC (AmiA/AmiB activator)
MTTELNHWREQVQVNSAARQHAEEEAAQLQKKLTVAQMRIDQLQQQNVKLSSRVRLLKKRIDH